MKIVKWFFITPVILIVLGIIGTELNKAYWDNQVRAMCEEDGGVTVFEKVHLTKEQYIKNDGKKGMIQVASKRTSKPYHDFFWESKKKVIINSYPKVTKYEYITYEKLTNKMLGKYIVYGRSGGDFPTGFHPSGFSCQSMNNFKTSSVKEIFSVEKE